MKIPEQIGGPHDALSERKASADCAPARCSVVFDGHIYKHWTHKAIYELCLEIEKLPASEQQTLVCTKAAALQNHIAVLRHIAGSNAKCLRQYAAECFPDILHGQKHFVRVLMEGVADELDENFNPPNKD